MCLGFLLNILFTRSVGKSIKTGVVKDKKPELITTGIYRNIRNPFYFAFNLAMFGTFLIIPCVLILVLLLFTAIVSYRQAVGEKKILLKMYSDEYENYIKKTGRFFPKLKNDYKNEIL